MIMTLNRDEITLQEYQDLIKAQGVPMEDVKMICPMCGTIQTAQDLINAGAGKDFEEVQKYVGFSCVGRWTHNKPPPGEKDLGKQVGCNWTLGGVLSLHKLVVVTPDGEKYPRFQVWKS